MILIISCYVLALRPGKSYPGDGGRAVHIPAELQAKSKESFKINQFNLVASDLMSLNRTLSDYRNGQLVYRIYIIGLFVRVEGKGGEDG